ncbi:MAG: suppressor of fused domain protein [Myxococcales bacterium]|nr:suppressor of fused domain protein [Myxococcales bacterium]
MRVQSVYGPLFEPLIEENGPLDPQTPVSDTPFDPKGELTVSRFVRSQSRFVTFVSSGLCLRPEQKPSRMGRYELLIHSDDEGWAREVLTDVARMSLDVRFEPGHTFDLSAWAFETDPLQGVVFDEVSRTRIDGERFGVLRCVGITRTELAFARHAGGKSLLSRLRDRRSWPRSDRARRAVVDPRTERRKSPLPSAGGATVGRVLSHGVQGLDLSFVTPISGYRGVSAVTVVGRSLGEASLEELWFRLDVRLEDDMGLVQVEAPLVGGALRGPPRLRLAWHDSIVFPPYDALLAEGGSVPAPEARLLLKQLYAVHLSLS